MISQPLVPLVVTLILLPTKGVKSPQNHNFGVLGDLTLLTIVRIYELYLGGVNKRFQTKRTKY